ncbi:hypothetical protein MPLA_2130102 [Mesorhizobium sp. ORS 3359]|nr:hypothetical protein MPLA_2130102 [Mesorhizobium sp. ORS 3359]
MYLLYLYNSFNNYKIPSKIPSSFYTVEKIATMWWQSRHARF